jgi:hypothetical protein
LDNLAGLVEVMAGSDEAAEKGQQLAMSLMEEPEIGKIYRSVSSS